MDTAPRGKKRRNPCKDCTKGTSIRLGKEERARDRSIWQRTQDSITGAEPQFKLLAPHPSESSSLWYSFFFSDDSVMNMLMWFFTDQGQPEEIHTFFSDSVMNMLMWFFYRWGTAWRNSQAWSTRAVTRRPCRWRWQRWKASRASRKGT